MSPSEEQLRAALRDGEPDAGRGPDADRLIARANEIRHSRRLRYGSVAGGLAAAAAAGLLIASLGTSTHSEHRSTGVAEQRRTSAQSSGNAPVAAGSEKDADGTGAAAGAGPLNSEAAAPCPATLPNRAKGTGRGSFFTGPVASFTLCVYAESGGAPLRTSSGTVLTTTVSGTAAQQLATSLDTAAPEPDAQPCPLFRTATGKVLALVPHGPDGQAMAAITTVVLDNPCNQAVTNGSVVRYNWTAPAVLTPYLHQAAAITAPTGRPAPVSSSPVEHGSPISS
jgi:hypothetical protein